MIFGVEVRLERGFKDLTSLDILAGYKFHKKTRDSLWGIKWDEIPASIQCYALGDIKFGFITYNVLAGILLRDMFPDPDVLCKYLECSLLE